MSIVDKSLKNQIADVLSYVNEISGNTEAQITTLGDEIVTLSSGVQTNGDAIGVLSSSLNSEIARATAAELVLNSKLYFNVTMEYDGLMVANSYPFTLGNGVPSAYNFGYFIPLQYELAGYTVQCVSSDQNLSLNFTIEGRNYDNVNGNFPVAPSWTNQVSLVQSQKYKYDMLNLASPSPKPPGCVTIKVINRGGVQALSDRYRVSLFFVVA